MTKKEIAIKRDLIFKLLKKKFENRVMNNTTKKEFLSLSREIEICRKLNVDISVLL